MSLRMKLIKHLMDFTKKPISNQPGNLLAVYIPFGFFPWRRLIMPEFFQACDESKQPKCDRDLLYCKSFKCECTILTRFLRSVAIELLLIPLVPIHFLFLLIEVPRLSIKNFRAMSQPEAETPPEIILLFLFEAVEAVPQISAQSWLFFNASYLYDPFIFWMSFTFSVIGIIKAIGTFIINYKKIVGGIVRIPTCSKTLTFKDQDLRMLPGAFIGNSEMVNRIHLTNNKLDKVTSTAWAHFFQKFPHAKYINLNENKLDDICVKHFAKVLPIKKIGNAKSERQFNRGSWHQVPCSCAS